MDDRKLGPETYTYTAKRYTFTYTGMRRVGVGGLPTSQIIVWTLVGTLPSWTSQTSLPSGVSTATIRLRYPVLNGRIPSCVPSIPRPIARARPKGLPLSQS